MKIVLEVPDERVPSSLRVEDVEAWLREHPDTAMTLVLYLHWETGRSSSLPTPSSR